VKYLIVAALFVHAVWVFFDAHKRRRHTLGQAAGWALGTLVLWLFVVPLYFAQRHLRAGETREGGDGWNYLKTLALLWTIVMLAVGAHHILAASEVASTAHTSAAQAGAAIGVTLGFGVGWFFPVLGALLLGLVLKKSSIVERGPAGPLASTACPTCGNAPVKGAPCPTCGRSASQERKRKGTMAVVGIVAAALVVGLLAVGMLKDGKTPKAVSTTSPSESAAARPGGPAVRAPVAADQSEVNRLSFAAFKGELLNECDDMEFVGSLRLPDAGQPFERARLPDGGMPFPYVAQLFANISRFSDGDKKNAPVKLKMACQEQFRDRTPLATCTFTRTDATGTIRGRIAHYAAKDVFSGDSLMKECLSLWHGTWNAVSRDSEEYRRAASLEASPGSPAIISDGQDTLQFGKPTVKDTGFGMTKVMVQVKNVTDRQISCMVTATFMKRDTILGTANGTVNDLRSGSIKTAALMTTDQIRGYDTVRLEPGTCF
jgi:hypothetical protein